MKLTEFIELLKQVDSLHFVTPQGALVPAHFHITEVGLVTRHYLNCGGTLRLEHYVNFQIWVADDTDHRLTPFKLLTIIDKAESLFINLDPEVEVEYQTETIGRYGLMFSKGIFYLTTKIVDCQAKDRCGIPPKKQKIRLSDVTLRGKGNCVAETGCC